jgi:hypothetical protein
VLRKPAPKIELEAIRLPPGIAADTEPLALIKKVFLELSPQDKYPFREWVVEQICGEVLH